MLNYANEEVIFKGCPGCAYSRHEFVLDLVNKTVEILRNHNICERFDYVFEEKENRHLHVWIMPRYDWMKEINNDIIDNIGAIFAYAKENLRLEENYKKIEKITSIIKENLK